MMITTPFKWAAVATAVITLAAAVMARDWMWGCAPDDPPIPVATVTLSQMPFDTPAFVPDEATKKRALKRAYEGTDK